MHSMGIMVNNTVLYQTSMISTLNNLKLYKIVYVNHTSIKLKFFNKMFLK